jgi:hypothetical protein
MGRKRSNFICPRCGEYGFKRTNPDAVVHYDSKTGKRRTCYYKEFLERLPPKEHWRHSALYNKLDEMQQYFERMALHISIIKNAVNGLPPDDKLSSKCVDYLNIFDRHLLIPLEKLLIPYTDLRWSGNWTKWFKVQMDNFEKGSRASGIINQIETGIYVMELGKDGKSVFEVPIAKEITSKQVKLNGKRIVNMARDLLIMNQLENALNEWSTKSGYEEITRDPNEFYRREMAKKKLKV